ncbi:vitamin D3 receptor B-like isoform X2 [Clavelina lepadiformis]|uniref:vitamin D3 receptor B-like isoform X2 n=1 Tax=Clavelina lepadiformis TaxID=159417 RepID=UPI0040431384
MMMTAGSVMKVDSLYNHMYQRSTPTNSDNPHSQDSKPACEPDMSFNFKSQRGHKDNIVYTGDQSSSSPEELQDLASRSLVKATTSIGRNHQSTCDNKVFPSIDPPDPDSVFFDDDSDDSWKVCGVCNDKATGYHFNALTCEGCKGFFRRSIKNDKSFSCQYNNKCNITKSNRRQCQACRLRKCIQIGMKRECIMSSDQIESKKNLVLTNRMKRTAQAWVPRELSQEEKDLLDTICTAFLQSNSPPDKSILRGGEIVEKDASSGNSPSLSPNSSNSSNFLDLIKTLSSDMVARTPSNMTNAAHVLHFTDIMEYSIREVIKFCKKIPTFLGLDLNDQIALLKAGCTEILFLKANYTYDSERKALTLGPDFYYTRESFLQGGMSDDYTDTYLKFHEDLSALRLDDIEMSTLSAIALFSADRTDIVDQNRVEAQQEIIACALQSYSDSTRNRFASIMAFLPRLRTLNALCTHAFSTVEKTFGDNIHPLVKEVRPDDDDPNS